MNSNPPKVMSKPSRAKILEKSKVYPSSPSTPTPTTIIPLTYLDIPWLFFPPSQPLFFYKYPSSTSHFMSITLPILKNSLSLALQLYFPFAGNLTLSHAHNTNKPTIVYSQDDYVPLTIAESNADFNYFCSDHAREACEFYSLVPELLTRVPIGSLKLPLLSVQVTIFPSDGVCIGLAYHHVAADGRTFNNFIKTWASLCGGDSSFPEQYSPSFDRTTIKDVNGLEGCFLREMWKKISSQEMMIRNDGCVDFSDMVRATFLMCPKNMDIIKQWIIGKCKKNNQPRPVHLSPYVLTCALAWVCLAKSQEGVIPCSGEDPSYFGFVAGGLTRLDFPVPPIYFGNCVGFGRAMTIRKELIGKDGIVVAASAIGNKIRMLDNDIFDGADMWISDWEVLIGSDIHVTVSGSPKLDLYETDFGLGRPKKIEDISTNGMGSTITLTESRDVKGGIEIGLALPMSQMDDFSSLFLESLKIMK